MPADRWIRFGGYEGRLDPGYGGRYEAPGLRYPHVEASRTWDIVRVDGEPTDSVYQRGQFTVLSRGHEMMGKAHGEAAAYRLHFRRCAGVGICDDIGHPGGPGRSKAQAIAPVHRTTPVPDRAAPDAGAVSPAVPLAPPAVERTEASQSTGDWAAGLSPFGEVRVRTVAPGLDLVAVPLLFERWDGPELGMREDCNKRGGRVVGDLGELSCAEVEIVKRLRRIGWDAAWVQAFRCGRQRWSAYIRDVPDFPDAVRRIQAAAGSAGGHPDVIAWRGDRVVAIESKGPGDQLRASQIEWFMRARQAGMAPGDLAMVEWRVLG